MWLERSVDPDAIGTSGTTAFILEAFRVGRAESVVDVSDPKDLTWNTTYHNFMDTTEAVTDTHWYELTTLGSYFTPFVYTVAAYEYEGGPLVWGPIDILPPG